MRGEIICIGDELISGRTADTNANYAAQRLWPLGITIHRFAMIGDDPAAISQALTRGLNEGDFLIICGGLGPTDDDLTVEVVADYLGLPLEESKVMMETISANLAKRGRKMNAELRKMCLIPKGAEAICGHCAGFYIPSPQKKPMFFLPGVPSEFRDLIDRIVTPRLMKKLDGKMAVAIRELITFGLPESILQHKLADLPPKGVKLGYYPHFPEVKLVITSEAPDQNTAESMVQATADEITGRLADNVVATAGSSIEQVVAKGLTERGLTLALAESCTGGFIGHRLTDVPGASDFLERGAVVYSNQAKQDFLGVKSSTLEKYGAVSAQTAREMALGIAERSGADLGLSVTGIAGPSGGSDEKPVGTVFLGLAYHGRVRTKGYQFHGSRKMVKAQSAEMALNWLRRFLADDAFIHST